MRFSLVVATLGRTTEVQRLLNSLKDQTYPNFEIIVVDQNTDGRLVPVLSAFENRLEIYRLTSVPGLSRARNLGLRAITGEVVCFPDDDCWYPEDLLDRTNQLLTNHPKWQGLIGDSVDQTGKPTLPWRDRKGSLTRSMSWRRAISYAIFLRSEVIREVGGFDEALGVGSGRPWGSGEDNDLVLRALGAGFRVQYDPSVQVHHPKLFPSFEKSGLAKRYNYALGDGKLLQRHPMPFWWRVLFFSVPVCKTLLAAVRLNRRETYFHWLTATGRLKGLMSAKNSDSPEIPFPLEAYSSLVSGSGIPVEARSAVS